MKTRRIWWSPHNIRLLYIQADFDVMPLSIVYTLPKSEIQDDVRCCTTFELDDDGPRAGVVLGEGQLVPLPITS